MSFALKPIDKRIQQVLEEKSKILSRNYAALDMQAGGMPDRLKEMQSRSTWIRWISGDENPAVILGGVGINDGGLGYSLAKGFKQVYCPPDATIMQYSPTQNRANAKSGKYEETSKPYFKPVAGVKSVTTTFEGSTKALRKTTVTWTVFDLNELEILTPHFLTPGKYTILEIGWNYDQKFFKNLVGDKLFDIKEASDGKPAKPKYDKFEDLGSLEEIIYQNRGDYDVFSGVITNFNYSVREDGGFDCTTTFATHGISLLDAGKDTTTFTVDAALSKTETTDDPVKITNLNQDNINIAMQKLATYFRVTVTTGANFKLNDNFKLTNDFYGPKDNTNWFTYVGVKGVYEGEDDEEFKGLKKSKEEWVAGGSRKEAALVNDMMTEDTPAASWVRWGWFEDNILSKYAGYATMNTDETGTITGINEVKLKFRSIDDVLISDKEKGILGEKKRDADGKVEKESVRILSHKKLLTTDVNKFILIGKTPTLDQEHKNSVYPKLGAFLNHNELDGLNQYQFEVTGSQAGEIEEGYIRNIFFNVRWIQEKFEGVGTLKEALDNIWNSFNTEYQNYWQFDVVGDINDLSLARLTDKNNSRYSVSEFTISDINLKKKTQSKYGCYKFPTWTKDSIVSNMDYSVTIPTSQVAVAALSGGSLDAEKIAQRNRGNIDVQTFVKGMHKSFEDSKERFFKNVTRIAEYSAVDGVAKFGDKDADENNTLIAGKGPDIIRKLYERDKDLINAIDTKGAGTWPSGKPIEESVIIKSSHEFFKTPTSNSPHIKDWPKLYEDGAIQSDGPINYKSTMLGVMHTSPTESKGALTDLLNGIAELKLTIDGTAGIFPGDAFTSHHLPNHLLKKGKNEELPLLFQATNVEQTLGPDGWKTTITGQPRMNHNHVYDKSKMSEVETFIANLRGEISAGAVTKEGVFTRLFQNRNILGINQEYLSKQEMFQGITKIRKDEYLGDLATTNDSTALGSWRDHLGVVEDKGKVKWTTSVTISEKDGTTKTIQKEWSKRCTPAIFKGKQIEEVMRFAMYNGILYSMPDEKLHNSKLAPYTSIDKTFQCLSYNLFKGDKPNMSRWQAGEVGGGRKTDTPSYTQQYIEQMETDLNSPEFSSLHHGFGGNKSGKGMIEKHGIRGLYTPMAILRRGKDIMRKFMWDEGGDITDKDKDAWDAAKDYQELFTFKYVTTMDITTAWLDGKKDGDRDIFNLTINGDNAVVYKIWFDFFKCMFDSYLGKEWQDKVQLIEHPEYNGVDTKTWKHDEEGLEKSGKIKKLDKFKGKKGLYTSEGLALINLFTEENMFVGGLDHFSVENEIHKFLQHMSTHKKEDDGKKVGGFELSPEIMYFRSHDISMGNNNTDWWTAVMNKSVLGWKHTKQNKWDSKYDFKASNPSTQIWPYGDGDKRGKITRPGHWDVTYTTDADGKKVRSTKWVLAKEKLD